MRRFNYSERKAILENAETIPVRKIMVKGLPWNLQTRILAALILRHYPDVAEVVISEQEIEEAGGLMIDTAENGGWKLSATRK